VAGAAWCLHEDLHLARALVGDVPVIAVNAAAREVRAFALFTQHTERFTQRGHEWIRHQRRLFGGGFTVHAPGKGTEPHVDHWWPDARGGGGSAWGARKVAWLMGFDPVILCGCPLDPGPYAGHRPGMFMTRANVIEDLRRGIEAEPHWHQGACSMSGWTCKVLGSPAGPAQPDASR